MVAGDRDGVPLNVSNINILCFYNIYYILTSIVINIINIFCFYKKYNILTNTVVDNINILCFCKIYHILTNTVILLFFVFTEYIIYLS